MNVITATIYTDEPLPEGGALRLLQYLTAYLQAREMAVLDGSRVTERQEEEKADEQAQ